MATRRFVFSEGTSNKFWEITVEGTSFKTRYGKVGTEGQQTLKSFGSPEAAEKEAAKLVAEKVKKGYVEEGADRVAATAPSSAPVATGAELVGASDLPAAFRAHFGYLADSPGAEVLLAEISKHAKGARMEGERLVVEFDHEDARFIACPPATKSYQGWPESFRKLVAHHEFIAFPEWGWSVTLGEGGTVDFEVEELPKIREVMSDYSDWWVVGNGKNSQGQPELSLLSHENCELIEVTDLNPGALFLKRVAEVMELQISLPETSPVIPPSGGVEPLPEVAKIAELPGQSHFHEIEGAPDWLVAHTGTEKNGTLAIFDASRPEVPRKLGECNLTCYVGTVFGYVKLQKVGDTLFIGGSRGYVEIDVTDPSAPRPRRSMLVDASRCAHWFTKDEVVFQYYLNDSGGRSKRIDHGASESEADQFSCEDGIYRQPIGGDPTTIERLGDYQSYAHGTLQAGELVLFQTQGGIEVYDLKSRKLGPGVRFNIYWPKIAALAPHPMAAVLETCDRDNFAVRILDLSKKKPAQAAKLFKKMDAQGWCLEGDRLWLILCRDTKKDPVYSLGAVHLPGCTEEAPWPLPSDLPWHQVAWMKVSGGRMAVLFEDGTVRTFVLPAPAAQERPSATPAAIPEAASPEAVASISPTSSGLRRLVYAEGSSNKFWEIALEGNSFKTRYGKVGTEGQQTLKSFGSPEAAAKEAAKLVAEKVKKGYREE